MNPDRTDYEGSIPLPVWEFFVKLYPTFDGDNHPKRVSSYAPNASEIIVAYFHDALEDGLVTEQDLIDVGLTEVQIEAVKILTRDKANESYDTYIARIVDSGNALAQAVKTYDLFDHLHPRLRATLPPSKAKRYLKALTALVLASS